MASDPVVAGALAATGATLGSAPVNAFRHAASYRARHDAIDLLTPELPLTDAVLDPTPGVDA